MGSFFGNAGGQQTGGVFGQTPAQQAQAGLFSNARLQPQGGSAFGGPTNAPPVGGTLFGSQAQQQQQQPQPAGNIFGGAARPQQQPPGGSIFGQPPPPGGSIFSPQNQQQQQQQQQQEPRIGSILGQSQGSRVWNGPSQEPRTCLCLVLEHSSTTR